MYINFSMILLLLTNSKRQVIMVVIIIFHFKDYDKLNANYLVLC